MTVHQIHESTIEVRCNHGAVMITSTNYQRLVEAYFGSVNQSRRVLAAMITAAWEINYFDTDEMTLLAVATSWGWEASTIIDGLAHTTDDFVKDVWNRFAE